MSKCFEEWTVLEHGELRKHGPNFWSIEGLMPNGKTRRIMTLVKMGDELIIHNGIALEDALMDEVTAWATPKVLVVPNGFHRQDAAIYKKRFPDLFVTCPSKARAKVSQIVAVDGTLDEVQTHSGVTIGHAEGSGGSEGFIRLDDDSGCYLVFNDLLLHMEPQPFPVSLMLAPMGQPSVPRFCRWFMVKDKEALRRQLLSLAESNPKTIVPGHGAPLTENTAEALRTAAASL